MDIGDVDLRIVSLLFVLAMSVAADIWMRREARKLSQVSSAANYITLPYVVSRFNWKTKELEKEAEQNELLRSSVSSFEKKLRWGLIGGVLMMIIFLLNWFRW